MKFRREDSNKYDFTATLTKGSDGNIAATMTSKPKAGIGAEDLLGGVIKLVNSDNGDIMYATLTSSVNMSKTVGSMFVGMVIGLGVIANISAAGQPGTIMLLHREQSGVVSETLTISMPTT